MFSKTVAVAFILAAALQSTPAAADIRIQIGILTCEVTGGVGFIVGSTRDLDCIYRPARSKYVELYRGTISRYGIDIGRVNSTSLIWGVLAPTSRMRPGALNGTYIGASAEVTAGVGLGANALIGGFDSSIALNPLSLQAQTGVNLAAGVAGLSLRAAR
jgi:hypothetical protein